MTSLRLKIMSKLELSLQLPGRRGNSYLVSISYVQDIHNAYSLQNLREVIIIYSCTDEKWGPRESELSQVHPLVSRNNQQYWSPSLSDSDPILKLPPWALHAKTEHLISTV